VNAALEDLETQYIRHYRSIYLYVLALTRSVDEAEEVTADTFERAHVAWSNGRRPLAGKELPWLLLTARRRATDRWRRTQRLASLRTSGPDRRATAEQNVDFWLWFDALSRVLTPRQREALLLRYQRDLTDADIANVMGLSPSGVRSLVLRALEALRSHPELLP
jgi:RNA polymerase sigma factor (sigma-70 family)